MPSFRISDCPCRDRSRDRAGREGRRGRATAFLPVGTHRDEGRGRARTGGRVGAGRDVHPQRRRLAHRLYLFRPPRPSDARHRPRRRAGGRPRGGPADRRLGAWHDRHGAELRPVAGHRSGAAAQSVFSHRRHLRDRYGVPAADEFIKDGYVLVATDYQGLGGGGTHQYAISVTQARDAIDAVRAVGAWASRARQEGGRYGWSQGGGTTLAAASLPDYIARTGTAFDGSTLWASPASRRIDVAAFDAEGSRGRCGGIEDVTPLDCVLSDNLFDFTHFSMNMWANAGNVPGLKMTDLFTDEAPGRSTTIYVDECIHPASDTINFNSAANFKSLLRSGRPI